MDASQIKETVLGALKGMDAPMEVDRKALDAFLDVYEDHYNATGGVSAKIALGLIAGLRFLTRTPDDFAGDED